MIGVPHLARLKIEMDVKFWIGSRNNHVLGLNFAKNLITQNWKIWLSNVLYEFNQGNKLNSFKAMQRQLFENIKFV